MSLNNVIKNIRHKDNTVIVDLSGEIDMHNTPDLRSHFFDVLDNRPSCLVINLSEVKFMDSSGLAILLEVLQTIRRENGTMKLYGLHPRVQNIFEISRLTDIFDIYVDEEEALGA